MLHAAVTQFGVVPQISLWICINVHPGLFIVHHFNHLRKSPMGPIKIFRWMGSGQILLAIFHNSNKCAFILTTMSTMNAHARVYFPVCVKYKYSTSNITNKPLLAGQQGLCWVQYIVNRLLGLLTDDWHTCRVFHSYNKKTLIL